MVATVLSLGVLTLRPDRLANRLLRRSWTIAEQELDKNYTTRFNESYYVAFFIEVDMFNHLPESYTAVVTGASGGIGRAMVQTLLESPGWAG